MPKTIQKNIIKIHVYDNLGNHCDTLNFKTTWISNCMSELVKKAIELYPSLRTVNFLLKVRNVGFTDVKEVLVTNLIVKKYN